MANNENLDSLDKQDELEYQRALEVLNSSKGNRIKKKKETEKKIKEEKASKLEEAKKKDWDKLSFIDKCKVDPVIPVCILLTVLAVVGAAMYFIIPTLKVNKKATLGITYAELQTKYQSTSVYSQYLFQFGFEVPDMTLQSTNNDGVSNSDESYFIQPIESLANSVYLNAVVEGTVYNPNSKLTELRVYLEINSGYEAETFNQMIMWFLESYVEVFYPSITDDEAMALLSAAIQSGDYYVYENYAVKIFSVNEGNGYIGLQIIPASSVNDYIPQESTAAAN